MKFVDQKKAEELAVKHIQNYLNECNCQSLEHAKLASQKMVAVAVDCMNKVHNGKSVKLNS